MMSMLQFARLPLEIGWLRHLPPIGLLLLIQVALALFRDLPLITADESVYLAHARYLSGAAPMSTLYGTHFFAFGYSLFLLPAFWLFDSPYETYTASLIINTLLMSTLYLILYYVLVSLLGISSRLAIIAAFITCLYPPLLLRSNFAWAENAYVPGFMLLIALFGTLLKQKSLSLALLFGLLLGFLYTIHARSLPLIPIAAVYLAALSYLRVLRWKHVAASLAATALVFIATRLVVNHLKSQSTSEIPEISVRAVLSHLVSLQGLHDFFHLANIQVLQVFQSSFGLFTVGTLAVGFLFWRRRCQGLQSFVSDVPNATLTFFVLAWLGTLAVAAAHLALPIQHIHFLHGRYADGVSALFLALGLSAVLGAQENNTWRQGLVLLVWGAVSTSLAIVVLPYFSPATFLPFSGIYPFLALFSGTPALICASAVALIGSTALMLATKHLRVLTVLAIGVLFIFTGAYNYRFGILPLQDRVSRSTTLASYIRAHIGSPAFVAYDTTYNHPLTYFTYEYLLPQTRFVPFDGASGEKPSAPIVISGHRWRDAKRWSAQFWQAEPLVSLIGADQALWTLPGPQQSVLLENVNYANTVLGHFILPSWSIDTVRGRPVHLLWGAWQDGFYHPSHISDRILPVWFDSHATIQIPTAEHPPRALLLNLASTVERATALHVQANGETLYADNIPPGSWCHLFPLQGLSENQLTLVELSQPPSNTTDTNTETALIVVRGITVLDHLPEMQQSLSADPLPTSAYRSRLASLSPLYPQVLPKGAMGTLRLSVTNAGNHPWPTPCETGQTPGTVQLGIIWFPQNSTNRSLSAAVAESRAALPYALAPGKAITLTAVLAPIKQDGDPLPTGEYEVWIGPVQEGISWFFPHGDDVLKIPVYVVR